MSKLTFDEDRALELYNQGRSDSYIGRELGIKMTVIGAWRNRRGLARNLPPEKHGTRPEVTVEIPEGLRSANESETPTPEPPPSEPEEVPPVEGATPIRTAEELPPVPVEVSITVGGCTVTLTADNPEQAAAGARYLTRIVEDIRAATAPIFIQNWHAGVSPARGFKEGRNDT